MKDKSRLSDSAKSVLFDLMTYEEDQSLRTPGGYWNWASRTNPHHLGENAYRRVFRELREEGFLVTHTFRQGDRIASRISLQVR